MPDALRENMALMLPPQMQNGLDKLPRNHLFAHFENTSNNFMQSKPMEMEKFPHISMMDTSGSKFNLYPNKSEGKGVGTNVFDTSVWSQQKTVVKSVKELNKRDKRKNSEKGSPDKNKRIKHLHPNRILKKTSRKHMKSKGESVTTEYRKKLFKLCITETLKC
jgi:hypothetical protein